MTTSLPGAVLDRLDAASSLSGEPRTIEPLPGGLTNLNFAVTTPRGRFVARLAGPTGDLLAIDRDAEAADSRAASSAGVAPAVVEYVPAAGVLVIEWVDAVTLGPADLRDADMLTRVAAALRRLHAGPRFTRDFDMFALQRHYLSVVRGHGFRLPARYLEFAPQVERVRAALAATTGPTVPCHNDLLAANLLDTGERITLIDWEYAGNNDECFELGNLWSEAALEPSLLDHLVTAYYGAPRPDRVARARLFALMSQYGWTLWACIQDAAGELDFDFWDWGMEKYERAVATFDDPAFDALLNDLQSPHARLPEGTTSVRTAE